MNSPVDRKVTQFNRRQIPQDATETRWNLPDGFAIRRVDWGDPPGAPKGSILFLPGRGDAYEKYLETLEHWHRAGWRVAAADWRGQAGSGRLGNDTLTGHVPDFAVWVDDLAALWQAWQAENPGPHILAAHSMGGHIALRAVAEARIHPDAIVLSAPMLGIASVPLPRSVLHAAARLMCALGDPKRPAWKWSERPGSVPAERISLLTHDAARYEDELWWREARPELAMGAASWGWVERAYASIAVLERPGMLESVNTPVLLLATDADHLVDFRAIERAATRLPRGRLVRFGTEAAHEILREADPVRDKALMAIDEFLDSVAV